MALPECYRGQTEQIVGWFLKNPEAIKRWPLTFRQHVKRKVRYDRQPAQEDRDE